MLTQNEIKETLEKFLVFKEKNLVGIYKSYASLYRSEHNYTSDHNKIREVSSLIDYNIFNKEIIQYLRKIDVFSYFGQEGLVTFGDITGKSPDTNATANALDNFIKELDERIRRIEYILETLNVLEPSKEEKDELESNEGLLSIHFQKQCNITGLEELSRHSLIWNKMIREMHLLNNENVDSNIKFKEIKKGSLIVNLLIGVHIAKQLGKFISWSLDQQKKYYEIQELKQKIKPINLDAETMAIVNEAIDKKINEKENEIAELVLENIKKENTFNNPDLLHGSEIQTIKFILTPLIDFIEKGGKLTVRTNAKTDEDIETEKLFSNLNLRIQNLSNPPSSENKLSNK